VAPFVGGKAVVLVCIRQDQVVVSIVILRCAKSEVDDGSSFFVGSLPKWPAADLIVRRLQQVADFGSRAA
jgi:hypothetical protein